MKQMVVGWGNPLVGDDGIGPRAAELVAARAEAGIDVRTSSHAGFRLVESMRGYDRVVVADVRVDTGRDLSIDVIRPETVDATLPTRHDGTLLEALAAFRVLQDLDLPKEIILITSPIPAPTEWRAALTAEGECAAQELADAVLRELEVTAVV